MRIEITSTLAIVVLVACVHCTPIRSVPMRPSTVTAEAVWAGGVDGGAWLDCRFNAKEPFTEYECVIWHDEGHLWSSGLFILQESSRDGWANVAGDIFATPRVSEFDFYTGTRVVISERRRLEPNGWIDHPFGDGHGKRVLYELGKEVETIEY